MGVSAPAILPRRSINLSLCMQYNYDLPWNISSFKSIVTYAARTEDHFDMDKETVYRYIAQVLDR